MQRQQQQPEIILRKVIIISILVLMMLAACQTKISNLTPSSPTMLVETIDTTSTPTTIPTLSPTAIATTGSASTPPTEPAITASFDQLLQSVPRSIDVVYVRDDYAYLNIGPILVILDVSNRQSPRPLGAVKLPVETILNLYVTDKYAYVAAAESGLRIVDISNPAQPIEVGVYNPPLIGGIDVIPYGTGPNLPAYLYRQGARGVAVDQVAGQVYAYVVAVGAGLRVVNVSNPSQPVEVGVLEISEGGFVDIAIANGQAYLAKPGLGLQIVDISDPTTPQATRLISLDWPNEIWSITLSTNQADPPYVYGAAGTCVSQDPGNCPGMLHIIDVSNPAAPKTFSSSMFNGYSTDLVVSDRYAYLLAMSGLHVLDISDPTRPHYINFLMDQGSAIAVAGDTLYLATKDTIQIFDLANPVSPVLVSQWPEEIMPEPTEENAEGPTPAPMVEPDATVVSPLSSPVATPTTMPAQTKETIVLDDWQSYTSKTGQFSIRYPSEYTLLKMPSHQPMAYWPMFRIQWHFIILGHPVRVLFSPSTTNHAHLS